MHRFNIGDVVRDGRRDPFYPQGYIPPAHTVSGIFPPTSQYPNGVYQMDNDAAIPVDLVDAYYELVKDGIPAIAWVIGTVSLAGLVGIIISKGVKRK